MTTTDPRTRLNEIKARADAAPEGPWATDIAAGDTGNIVVYGQAPDDDYPHQRTLVDADVITMDAAEFIAHARTDVDDMAAALTAVLNLHRPVDVEPSETICHGCSTLRGSGENARYFPFVDYPCPTVRAITAHLPTTADALSKE